MIPKKSDLNETNKTNIFKNLLNFLRKTKSKKKRKKQQEKYEQKIKESSNEQNFIKVLVLGPGNLKYHVNFRWMLFYLIL
jgi:hypothetical protein